MVRINAVRRIAELEFLLIPTSRAPPVKLPFDLPAPEGSLLTDARVVNSSY